MERKPDLAKVQGYIPPEWKEAIRRISKRTGLSESSIVKMAVEKYLREKGEL